MATDRRAFLASAAGFGAVPLLIAADSLCVDTVRADEKGQAASAEAEIPATEDLMREHGILNRILLIYEEAMRRLRKKDEVPPEVFRQPAMLVRKFIEDYHETLEECFIFPRFEKKQKLVDLVTVLRRQHQAGRGLTDAILRAADQFTRPESQKGLLRDCEAFIHMYRPHEAREDTVLFPTLREIVPADEIKDLGEHFEMEEHRLFGDDGFQKTVDEVAAIEKQLGIYDLAAFTPR